VRTPLEFWTNEGGTADSTMDRHTYKYQATARYAVGYGAWQQACKVVNS